MIGIALEYAADEGEAIAVLLHDAGEDACMCLARDRAVAQVSKPAVSRVSNPQTLRRLQSLGTGDGAADWKSAIQQVWKPALRPKGAKQIPHPMGRGWPEAG